MIAILSFKVYRAKRLLLLKKILIFIFNFISSELFIWIAALVYLAIFNQPYHEHFTICPFKNLGIAFCPGCGLGNSISFLFRGDINSSFAAHPFGAAALIILIYRIFILAKQEGSKYAKRSTINA